MKFTELRAEVLKAVKAIQAADFAITQALIDVDLSIYSDQEIDSLSTLVEKSSEFRWQGMSKFSSEKYRREREDRERREAEATTQKELSNAQ